MICSGLIHRRLINHAKPKLAARLFRRTIQTFAEGDYVWLHHHDGMRPHWRQIPPVGRYIRTRKGSIPATAIIGRSTGDTIETSTQDHLRLTQPTLEEHILYVERLIYPRDANLIVSRLDLHPDPPLAAENARSSPPLEILEAGTGMGGLSLFLARALHAMNPPCAAAVRSACASDPTGLAPEAAAELVHYKRQRRSVLHTVERSDVYATHARRVIGSFRSGLYAPTVDQYVGDVGTWLRRELDTREGAFLAHAVLDLPNAEAYMPLVTHALKPDGMFLLWAPSISQVEEAVRRVATDHLALVLDEVLELGTNLSGGRQWAVHLTRLKQRQQLEEGDEIPPPSLSESSESARSSIGDDAESATNHDSAVSDLDEDYVSRAEEPRHVMVARPRVVMLSGGGFLAVFRRQWDGERAGLPRDKWAKGELKAAFPYGQRKEQRKASWRTNGVGRRGDGTGNVS